jgi:hypothetical protein
MLSHSSDFHPALHQALKEFFHVEGFVWFLMIASATLKFYWYNVVSFGK